MFLKMFENFFEIFFWNFFLDLIDNFSKTEIFGFAVNFDAVHTGFGACPPVSERQADLPGQLGAVPTVPGPVEGRRRPLEADVPPDVDAMTVGRNTHSNRVETSPASRLPLPINQPQPKTMTLTRTKPILIIIDCIFPVNKIE